MELKLNKNIENKVLDLVKPNESDLELFDQGVMKIKRKILKSARNLDIKCDVFIGGSYGKGTFLKNASDVDFFIRFDLSYDDDLLSEYLQSILNDCGLDYKKQKGSRDYFSGVYSPRKYKIKFEIIPVFKIKTIDEAKNSTDLSCKHVKFVLDNISSNLDLVKEIRITKQFFKSKRLYGAESYINGFSGHVIDILVIYYKSFTNLISSAKSWDHSTIIDINNIYSGKEDLESSIGYDKLSNLIVIDPIVNNRNASRALSEENYNRFLFEVNTIEEFKFEDFVIEKVDFDMVLENSKQFAKENNLERVSYRISFDIKNESEDIVGSKLKKIYGKIIRYFESFDFKVFHSEFLIDCSNGDCLFIFLFEKVNLPKVKKILGPKVTMTLSIEKFLEKRDYHFIEGERVCSYEKRSITKISEIYRLEIKELEDMINKDISFVKKLKITK
jgi:tRNA nucleotidyltransferase (CCA-adding enzyme)